MPSLEKNYHVVFVDDSQANNFLTQTIIEMDNLSIHASIFDDPNEALAFIAEQFDAETPQPSPIDFIFIDLNMPQLHGFQFMEQYEAAYQNHPSKVRIGIMTSNIVEENQEKAATFPSFFGMYVKPFSPEIWQEVLDDVTMDD